MKSGVGDRVVLHAPGGTEHLQILEVRYQRIPVEPFRTTRSRGRAARRILAPTASSATFR